MSRRNQNTSFIDTLRNIEERLRKLESSQNNSVKRNDIRIGDIVVSASNEHGLLIATNTKTNEQTTFGKMPEQSWSFQNVLTVTGGDEDVGHPYVVPHNVVVTEIVLAFTNRTTATTVVGVQISNKIITCTIDINQFTSVTPANVGMMKNEQIYPTLVSTSGAIDHDLTVTARFGMQVFIPHPPDLPVT